MARSSRKRLAIRSWWGKRFRPPASGKQEETQSRSRHISLGTQGESMACSYLKRHGYTILQRDYSNKFGQIDIIALEKKTETVCFVEVKTRTNLDFGPPEQAVSRRQKKRLVRAAKAFLHSRNAFTMPYRFDIIAIDASSPRPELRHFKGAFTPESAFGRRDW